MHSDTMICKYFRDCYLGSRTPSQNAKMKMTVGMNGVKGTPRKRYGFSIQNIYNIYLLNKILMDQIYFLLGILH